MRISISATAISVAVMIIAMSLVNGFQETIREKVFGFWGHVRIQERQPPKSMIAEELPLQRNAILIDSIRKQPGIRSVHGFATRYGIVKSSEDLEGLLIKGVDGDFFSSQLGPFLKKGNAPSLPDSGSVVTSYYPNTPPNGYGWACRIVYCFTSYKPIKPRASER